MGERNTLPAGEWSKISCHVGQVVKGILRLETRWFLCRLVMESKSNGEVCNTLDALSKSQVVFPFLNRIEGSEKSGKKIRSMCNLSI